MHSQWWSIGFAASRTKPCAADQLDQVISESMEAADVYLERYSTETPTADSKMSTLMPLFSPQWTAMNLIDVTKKCRRYKRWKDLNRYTVCLQFARTLTSTIKWAREREVSIIMKPYPRILTAMSVRYEHSRWWWWAKELIIICFWPLASKNGLQFERCFPSDARASSSNNKTDAIEKQVN